MKTRYYCKGDEGCGSPCILHAPKHDGALEMPEMCPYEDGKVGYWVKQIKVDGKWVSIDSTGWEIK